MLRNFLVFALTVLGLVLIGKLTRTTARLAISTEIEGWWMTNGDSYPAPLAARSHSAVAGAVYVTSQSGTSGWALLGAGIAAASLALLLWCCLLYACCVRRLEQGPSPVALKRMPDFLKPAPLRQASRRMWLDALPDGPGQLQRMEGEIRRKCESSGQYPFIYLYYHLCLLCRPMMPNNVTKERLQHVLCGANWHFGLPPKYCVSGAFSPCDLCSGPRCPSH